jgi:tetratricopeptide (TPR) repeat protein
MRGGALALLALTSATWSAAAGEDPFQSDPSDGGPDGGVADTREPLDRDGAARLSRKALARIKEGAWQEATELLRRAHEKDPRNAAIATDYGFALAHLGRREDAERLYRAAVDADPSRFYAYVNLAELWGTDPLRWQRRDEMVGFLQKALVTLAGDARARANVELRLAELMSSLGRASDARTLLRHLTGATVPAPVRRRAIELGNQVDVEAHERALEDWPVPTVTPDDLAVLEKARTTDDVRSALAILDQLIERRSGWVPARWQRALVLERLGQLDEASADLTVVVQLSPSHAQAWRRLGMILAQHGGGFEAERADEALRHALALEPSWSDLRDLRKQVAAKRARGLRRRVTERAPEPTAKARQLFQDAQSWMNMDAPEMAPPLLAQALEETPGFVEAAAALFGIEQAVPEATIKALWDDGAELWRLAQAVGALRSHDIAAIARPWIDRAVELGNEEARFGRASLRAAAGDQPGALADLRDYLAAEPAPPRLDEARALRTTLGKASVSDSPERLVHLWLSEDRPQNALTALGGTCHVGLPFDNLLAIGKVYEFMGDAPNALACYQRALAVKPTPRDGSRRALGRLAAAAAGLPALEIARWQTDLEAAAKAEIPLAELSLARMWEARQAWAAANDHVRTFFAKADGDEPRRGEAQALQSRIGTMMATETEQRDRHAERMRVGLAITGCLLVAGLLLRRRYRKSLAQALRAQPLLFPALVKSLGRIRHDVLKHRTSALELVAEPSTVLDDVARALREPTPTSKEVAEIYDHLMQEARGLGVRLYFAGKEPVVGPLLADLEKAEALVERGDRAGLLDIGRRLRELHLDRMQGLLRAGPRTTLNAALLARWIEGVADRHASRVTPGLYLQGAQIAFPLPQATLASIVHNLLRNALDATAALPTASVEVRVEHGRDGIGRRTVTLVVADDSLRPLDQDVIEARPSDRGLGIVRDTTRSWGGEIIVRSESTPFRKSVGIRFPAPPEAGP